MVVVHFAYTFGGGYRDNFVYYYYYYYYYY